MKRRLEGLIRSRRIKDLDQVDERVIAYFIRFYTDWYANRQVDVVVRKLGFEEVCIAKSLFDGLLRSESRHVWSSC